ncbi:uncharacterized protein V6R79_021721 [Siganus canaliculatus]
MKRHLNINGDSSRVVKEQRVTSSSLLHGRLRDDDSVQTKSATRYKGLGPIWPNKSWPSVLQQKETAELKKLSSTKTHSSSKVDGPRPARLRSSHLGTAGPHGPVSFSQLGGERRCGDEERQRQLLESA